MSIAFTRKSFASQQASGKHRPEGSHTGNDHNAKADRPSMDIGINPLHPKDDERNRKNQTSDQVEAEQFYDPLDNSNGEAFHFSTLEE
ncbi:MULTISPECIES: hypothetical protein [Moorena]|uniref:hypothetical protein n=1 Tax=Moorena TaxID=1155738 RepID=UPI001313FB1D|nr:MULTISPECIES: hypothetical protein [Moorena]NEO11497.1 hypothetical protein [Moorena sp. SIO3E8]NEP97957.1 hypothetical protein [Moorena sp. SIO3F7]